MLNPVFITGDFNCNQYSEPYGILTTSYQDRLSIFNSSNISEETPFGPSGSYNGFSNDNPTSRIDFVFVNDFMKVKKCGVINEKPNDTFIF